MRALPLVAGPIHPVDEQDVLPAVGVVIEKCATGAESLGKQLAAVGAAVVLEMDSGCEVTSTSKSESGSGGQTTASTAESRRAAATARHAAQKLPPLHGMFTKPFRIA